MYCKHCGKEIDDNSKFCKYCGKQLVDKKKIIVEFTKPKSIENSQTYLKRLGNKYSLFYKILKEKDDVWAIVLVGIVAIVWIFFLTFGIIGGLLSLFSINLNDVPESYGVIIGLIITLILLNWFVNFYIKHEQSKN